MTSIIVPSDEKGVIFDSAVSGVISQSINVDPFAFQDAVMYSHAWSTDADRSHGRLRHFLNCTCSHASSGRAS